MDGWTKRDALAGVVGRVGGEEGEVLDEHALWLYYVYVCVWGKGSWLV